MTPFLFSLCAALATLIGGLIIVYRFEWAKRNGDRLTAVAAGVLVSLSLVEVVPEAVARYDHAGIFAAIGFLAMYLFENLSGESHCAGDECPERDISMIAWVALLAHSFVDGIALSASHEISERFGLLVGLGVLLHEFPEGLASGALLLHRGFSRGRIFLLTAIVGCATPLGALAAQFFLVEGQIATWTHPFLAAIAGSFIYTGVAGLLTHSHRKKDASIVLAFLVGFAVPMANGLLH